MKHLLVLLAVLPFSVRADAAAVKSQHVTVDLVSEKSSLQSGTTFDLGLSFTLEPGWHLYWQNPGDSGEPPNVRWTLPDGMKAGQIEWPRPERMQLQSIVNYVYSGQLLLPVTMHAGFVQGTAVTVSADVRWLVCRDICLPGKATISLALPVSTNAQDDATQKAALAQARAKIPVPLPENIRTRTVDDGQQFIVSISPLDFPAKGDAEFFPLVPEQADNATLPRIAAAGKGLRILLKKSDQLLKPIAQLSGVLVLQDGRSFVVNSPVTALSATRKKGPRTSTRSNRSNSPDRIGQ